MLKFEGNTELNIFKLSNLKNTYNSESYKFAVPTPTTFSFPQTIIIR